jgi:hypothetical protein
LKGLFFTDVVGIKLKNFIPSYFIEKMKIKHYTLDPSDKLGKNLHLYEFPFSNNYKGIMCRRVATDGPATVFISPNGNVAVLTNQTLNRENFKDCRFVRKYIDRIKIINAEEKLKIEEVEISLLGRCSLEGCSEVALFEEDIPVVSTTDGEEGYIGYACSVQHLREIGGNAYGRKRKPLEELERAGKVMITIK